MSERNWSVVRPSSLIIFSLLVILSLATGPLAAQATATPTPRPICATDASVMGWEDGAASPATFTMTKDCQIMDGANVRYLPIRNNKTFTIDGAGFTIYAASKAFADFLGTVFGFDAEGNISLTLKNLTIEGGGTATGSSRAGNTPDPAIVFRRGTLVLDNVTIQNTRGGAIRIIRDGTVTLKDSTFIGNQVSGAGSANQGTIVTASRGSTVNLQGLFTAKNNIGGQSGIYINVGGNLNIDNLTCLDAANNLSATNERSLVKLIPPPGLVDAWNAVPEKSSGNCPSGGSDTPAPPSASGNGGADGSEMEMEMSKEDANYDRRIPGTVGSESVYYLAGGRDMPVLQIYRVAGGEGHWVMDVPQAAIDALGGAGCVVSSADGRYAVRVQAGGDVTISDGPDHENKVLHNTLQGGVSGGVISTDTTYGTTPPGVGCPGYAGG